MIGTEIRHAPSPYGGRHSVFSAVRCQFGPRRPPRRSGDLRAFRSLVSRVVPLQTLRSMQVALQQVERFHLVQRFRRLTAEWKQKSSHMSSITDMAMLPAYQRIIGMGPPVIPLILRELSESPDHWFWALAAITEEDPVPRESWGKVTEMTAAWLDWGRRHGHTR